MEVQRNNNNDIYYISTALNGVQAYQARNYGVWGVPTGVPNGVLRTAYLYIVIPLEHQYLTTVIQRSWGGATNSPPLWGRGYVSHRFPESALFACKNVVCQGDNHIIF